MKIWLKEHILEIIGIILDIIFAKPIIESFDKRWIGWLIITIIFISLILILFRKIFFIKKPKITYPKYIIWGPHRNKIAEFGLIEICGVLWKFNLGGRNVPNEIYEYIESTSKEVNEEYEQYILDELDIWTEDPYCKKCQCQMNIDNYKAKWICPNCGEKVKIPKRIWHDPKDQILKIFKSMRRNKHLA